MRVVPVGLGVTRSNRTFPFSAIVGQATLKTALLVNAVDPRVGGVLIRGEKGTAKSTAVRALASVLPPIRVVEGCRFSCDPDDPVGLCVECQLRAAAGPLTAVERRPRVVELPVSATEDRLIGTLDMEHALKHGERRFEAGLMAAANRGILYVDEVNLLDDHLVDTLLDAAAMGVNTVEREGVAFSHPARFILVGTMNPEEGEVRPQLLDRFGLCADVVGLSMPDQRVEVLQRREGFEDDPEGFSREWEACERELEESLARARDAVRSVRMPRELLFLIANACAELGVDGHRADLTMARAAAAFAALEGRDGPTAEDVRSVAPLVLAHRMRRRPFEDVSFDQMRLDVLMPAGAPDGPEGEEPRPQEGQAGDGEASVGKGILHQVEDSGVPAVGGQHLVTPLDAMRRNATGRRQETRSDDRRGRYTASEQPRPGAQIDIAVDATIRQAASRGRRDDGGLAVTVEPEDIRNKVRRRRVGASIVFCVDASGSMGASNRMDAAKGAVLDLLLDAYRRRDRVGLVAFRGEGAEVVLVPTASVELAQLRLRKVETGGATPLAAGIERSLDLLAQELRRDPKTVPWLVLVTDGRANVGLSGGLGSDDARAMAERVRDSKVHALVLDTTEGLNAGSAARELARLSGGEYVRLPRAEAATVTGAVRERLEAV
ncbi:MAG: magnesium chelatase subunit D family protein [Coriobacteriia bacterium]|nr:magnesium chelatase subunit D family protein [Coriobacteriia bacterium]